MTHQAQQTVLGRELWQWWVEAKKLSLQAGVPPQELDWLIQELTDLDRLSLRLETFKDRSQIPLGCSLDELKALWQQRLHDRVPVQYLSGRTPWRKFSLAVSPGVLIPRPETEELIDIVQQVFPQGVEGDWVDLGTGSGAIACGLADAFPAAKIHGVDCSPQALQIAQQNAENLSLTNRIQFHLGCWWEPLGHLRGQVAGMVSNPPYIPSSLIPQLQPEVVNHEPHLALDGGVDGLDCLRHLIQTAPEYLGSGGLWLVELMAGQAPRVVELLEENGHYHKIQVFQDLAGIERFVLAFRRI